ncbi:hypothetical protein L1286_02850 [Pseudoalteromonas sp. SMS1]|uniref:hypothetical protein n=1 Tax=Pseudoalteromonas sp. SMS1 TaxID=2908894 RepID=UPI001F1FE9E3|nr:hypothetical protein [Pseudoalteromonas sp. SMS1]MCF2856396.1 hypothetical protein [Pseudoalteromonas sp. SMS1]
MHMILAYIFAAILIKTSLLGLGLVSIMVCFCAMLILTFNRPRIVSTIRAKFLRLFKIALFGHISAYLGLLIKAYFIDGVEDIPAFIVGHFVLHHILCAIVAGTVTILTLRLYTQSKHLRVQQSKAE